jgi:hypothetical protein
MVKLFCPEEKKLNGPDENTGMEWQSFQKGICVALNN